jgi:hypothetical protein
MSAQNVDFVGIEIDNYRVTQRIDAGGSGTVLVAIPTFPYDHNDRGFTLLKLQRPQEALDAFEQALLCEKDPAAEVYKTAMRGKEQAQQALSAQSQAATPVELAPATSQAPPLAPPPENQAPPPTGPESADLTRKRPWPWLKNS